MLHYFKHSAINHQKTVKMQCYFKPDPADWTCLCFPQSRSNRSTSLEKMLWIMMTSHVKVRGRLCDDGVPFRKSCIPDLNDVNPSIRSKMQHFHIQSLNRHVTVIWCWMWCSGGTESQEAEDEYYRTAQASWVQRMFTSLFSDSVLFNTREGRAGKVLQHGLMMEPWSQPGTHNPSHLITRFIISCWASTWTPTCRSRLLVESRTTRLSLRRRWTLSQVRWMSYLPHLGLLSSNSFFYVYIQQ